jgi:hypothetical protein
MPASTSPRRRPTTTPIPGATFADVGLARRLEAVEGWSCALSAEARCRIDDGSASAWLGVGGGYAVFDGADSPLTQSFGLGLAEPLTGATLDAVEDFFAEHGAPAQHEICPLAGVPAIALLVERGYRPVEVSNVLFREVERPPADPRRRVEVHVINGGDAAIWSEINARGWADVAPDLHEPMRELGRVIVARDQTWCFLAEVDGVPGAAGVLTIHEGVALFGGASTVPELRHRGLQAALLAARMRFAHQHRCDLAMIVAEVGGGSQRNAERRGFRVGYTRSKWSAPPRADLSSAR